MTDSEFLNQYKRLMDVFPNKFDSTAKSETVFKFVKDLEINWFEKLVDRIVMTPHGDVDIGESVAGERRARKSVEFANDVSRSMDCMFNKITEKGLEKTLGAYGSETLWEAIRKSAKGELKTVP